MRLWNISTHCYFIQVKSMNNFYKSSIFPDLNLLNKACNYFQFVILQVGNSSSDSAGSSVFTVRVNLRKSGFL
jgi:hypothetical protein